MTKGKRVCVRWLPTVLATVLMAGCGGSGGSTPVRTGSPPGTVFMFGTDAPVCDVQSMIVTITSANLVPQGGGTGVSLISSASPATVDFVRLSDFTNVLASNADVPPATYTQLKVGLTNPQLTVLDTSTDPPKSKSVAATLTATSLTINLSPALVVSSHATNGLVFDFNVAQSLALDTHGQVTGSIDPQITLTQTTPSGTTVGEADRFYGIIQSVTTSGVPSGFSGSFNLALQDGTGQTLTILTNASTLFDGDGVTGFSGLQPGLFVEADAVVNTSGQLVAQIIDAEEQTTGSGASTGFMGQILSISQDTSGNATSFTLLVTDEIPATVAAVPLNSNLTVTLSGSTTYFTNWQTWNRESFVYGPKTVGVAQKVAVWGTATTAGTTTTLPAQQVFLRPHSVPGVLNRLVVTGADGKSGGFTLTPCGSLFGGKDITVITYADTTYTGVSGIGRLTSGTIINNPGVLFYTQTNGASPLGVAWTAPTWVLEARGVHQLPD